MLLHEVSHETAVESNVRGFTIKLEVCIVAAMVNGLYVLKMNL